MEYKQNTRSRKLPYKKILYLGGFELPDKNAAAQRVVANAKALRINDCEVSFIGISHTEGNWTEGEFDGFKYKNISYPETKKDWLKYLSCFVADEKLKEEKPDVIITYNMPALATWNVIKFGRKYHIKVWGDITEWYTPSKCNVHDLILRFDVWWRMYVVYPKLDGIIAISKYLNDFYKNKTRTIQVPPLVDLSHEKWNRSRNFKQNDKVQLVYAGSPSADKDRLDKIIEIVSKYPNISMRIIGINQEQYNERFNSTTVPDNITFLGRVTHTEALRNIQECDFQMFIRDNNRINTAGFPTKFVEAIGCCTPVITNASSNISDYLQNGKNGFVISDDFTAEEILRTISTMPKEEIVKMKEYCRTYDAFDFRKYSDLFKELL